MQRPNTEKVVDEISKKNFEKLGPWDENIFFEYRNFFTSRYCEMRFFVNFSELKFNPGIMPTSFSGLRTLRNFPGKLSEQLWESLYTPRAF